MREYRSKYFLPTLREDPSEAEKPSHRLMLRAGMIRQGSSGIYTWLPLGLRVLQKVESIVRDEMNKSGAIEILMPTIQSADLWRQSGRYDSYGKEMLRIRDRHDRELLYGPTNEEVITQIFAQSSSNVHDVPLMLYQLQWKFRDEIRPRFGVMRGREFYMKDAYSFDKNQEEALISYRKMFLAYLRSLARMGFRPIPMRADTGPIGGDHSHEFVVLADTGESQVFCDSTLLNLDPLAPDFHYRDDLRPLVQLWTKHYAATDEEHDPQIFSRVKKEHQISARGIELGHIFYFGDQYSKSFSAHLGKEKTLVHMGSYGIGISRAVGALIEANHDEKGIIWPQSVAPFDCGLANLASHDSRCLKLEEQVLAALKSNGCSVLVDDRKERPGVKFNDMDLIGLPFQVIIGSRHGEKGLIEVKERRTGKVSLHQPAEISALIGTRDVS